MLSKHQCYSEMLHYLIMGTILGLSAGLAPGPLLFLVISETLQHNIKAGVKVALAPILTDLPIIIVTIAVISKLSQFHAVLGAISILGGCFVFYLGYENIRITEMTEDLQDHPSRSLKKGIFVNALSPHPYLFWLSVGAPITVKALDYTLFAAAAFINCFYVFLVGAKILTAVLVGKSRNVISGPVYIYTVRFLGVLLCFFSILLIYDGLKLF